eukprot:GHRQ01040288.1.p1 GENE.GHRQ01040288.1~~GHRQ01040288.1.p1  ORF type:complete len:184 (-),score=28.93 GHRQ01040288.1:58-609(-)
MQALQAGACAPHASRVRSFATRACSAGQCSTPATESPAVPRCKPTLSPAVCTPGPSSSKFISSGFMSSWLFSASVNAGPPSKLRASCSSLLDTARPLRRTSSSNDSNGSSALAGQANRANAQQENTAKQLDSLFSLQLRMQAASRTPATSADCCPYWAVRFGVCNVSCNGCARHASAAATAAG